MAIYIKCPCGEKYQTDEKHLGYSIKCHKCNRIVAISDDKAKSYSSNTRSNSTKAIFEDVSIESKTPFLKNIVIPIAGALALLIGIILTVNSVREQKNNQSDNSNAKPALTPAVALSNSPILSNVNAVNTNQKLPNSSNKSIEVAQINSNTQPVNIATTQNTNSFQATPSPTPETVRYSTGKNLMDPQNIGGLGVA